MKLGSIVALALVLAGIAFTVRAFIANTSPYVKVNQLETRGEHVHLPLKPLHDTVQFDIKTMTLTFEGEDETGRVKVVYPKGKPNNFEAATQVVAIGSYKDGVFHAEEMLVKCPSKYHGESQK
ncbi:MAG: cytochrome c maturation protein CcmE [Fimbriimonadales bacterium]